VINLRLVRDCRRFRKRWRTPGISWPGRFLAELERCNALPGPERIKGVDTLFQYVLNGCPVHIREVSNSLTREMLVNHEAVASVHTGFAHAPVKNVRKCRDTQPFSMYILFGCPFEAMPLFLYSEASITFRGICRS
jgi:hypothetical protein